jgi:hypothetical protein
MPNGLKVSSRWARFISLGIVLPILVGILASCGDKPKQSVPANGGYILPEKSVYLRVCQKTAPVNFDDLADLKDVAVCQGGEIQWTHTKGSGDDLDFTIKFPTLTPFRTSPGPISSSSGTAQGMNAALPDGVTDVYCYDYALALSSAPDKSQNVHIIVLGTKPIDDLIHQP